ncbi:TIGR03085 family metal-binding protein [Nocardioides cavernaquae]|uniref:TIGR03085 family protein n=1 Tax=Nocardioides cavernaquae TaxID=2321396 RepID=A0A3A5H8K6_9ACTN|nr:TIGR03085 family metal-binding protein [Nocardioides cavernaquae]RJS46986.1 TIGR03085 family protein [Nocardioides cavernaquae]
MTSAARTERELLCDLALTVGPDAPTLSGDWDVRHLMAHLVVRDRQPHNGIGIVVTAFADRHDRAVDRTAEHDFATLVDRVRTAWSPLSLPGVDSLANTVEFFVHHEDVRRARPGWEPRVHSRRLRNALWRVLPVLGRSLVVNAGVPVRLRRTDSGDTMTLRRGANPVVLSGDVGELVLFLYGRKQTHGLSFDGPDAHVTALKAASLGF